MSAPFLSMEHFHAVDAETCAQTIAESRIECAIDMGEFVIHSGTRYGSPVVIVEHKKQQADQLSAVWFNDGSAS